MKLFTLVSASVLALAQASTTYVVVEHGAPALPEEVFNLMHEGLGVTTMEITDSDTGTVTTLSGRRKLTEEKGLRGSDLPEEKRELYTCFGGTFARCITAGYQQWLCRAFCEENGGRKLQATVTETAEIIEALEKVDSPIDVKGRVDVFVAP